MSALKSTRYLLNLPAGLRRAKIDGSSHCNRPHIVSPVNGAKHHLIIRVGVGQKFVMINLDDKRDLVSIFTRYGSQYSKGRSNAVTTSFDGKFDNFFGIKIVRIGSE